MYLKGRNEISALQKLRKFDQLFTIFPIETIWLLSQPLDNDRAMPLIESSMHKREITLSFVLTRDYKTSIFTGHASCN